MKIPCRVCSKQFHQITGHLKAHNLTVAEYKGLFPNAPIFSDVTMQKLITSKIGNQYALGVIRSPETRLKLSIANIGRTLSAARKREISLINRRHWADPNSTFNSKEFRERRNKSISLAQIERYKNPLERLKTSNSLRGHTSWAKGLTKDMDERIAKCANAHMGKPLTPERRRNVSIGNTRAWSLKSPEERREIGRRAHLTAIRRGVRHLPKTNPNKLETSLQCILDKLFPNEWQYVGGGQIWIGRFNPDFMNVNGKKQLIEAFGDYWHRGENPQERIDYFAKFGFNCLVLWERELKDEESISTKIRDFTTCGAR